MIDRRFSYAWSWTVAVVLAALLSLSGAEAQTTPGTGFRLRPGARLAPSVTCKDAAGRPVTCGPINLACEMFDAAGRPIGTPAELAAKRLCRYGGAIDRPGLHVNVASECLRWAFTARPDHPDWNRALPASAYTGEPTAAEREDAWMSQQGSTLLAGCPGWSSTSGGASVLTLTPDRLVFTTTGLQDEQVAALKLEAGVNQRWAVETPSAVVGAGGAVEGRLSLDVRPRRGSGPATLQVTLNAAPGPAAGDYRANLRVSGGQLKIDRPVAIRVSGETPPPPPVDEGPIDSPTCEVAVRVTEASAGRVTLTLSIPPCLQERPR